MDRREFLRRALALAPALVVVPPVVKYFLPPSGGWPGASLVAWGEHTLEAWIDHDMQRMFTKAMRELELAHAERLFNPALISDLSVDLQAFGSAIVRATPGAVNRVPPHQWHTLEVARG